MKINKSYSALGIVLIGIIVIFTVTSSTDSNVEVSKSAASQAPEFALLDYDGNSISSTDISGPAIINVWATWCPFCKNELPDFAEIQREFPEVEVVAVNREESRESAQSFSDTLESNNIIWLLDETGSVYKAIGGFAMPETLFVNAEGVIVVHKRGPMRLDEIRTHTEKIVSNTEEFSN